MLSIFKRRATLPRPEKGAGAQGKTGVDANALNPIKLVHTGSGEALINSLPVRLVYLKEFFKFADSPEGCVPFFEILPSTAYVEIRMDEFINTYADKTVAISWRWNAKKPSSQKEAESKIKTSSTPCPLSVVETVRRRLGAEGINELEYVWIDWCCAPQFGLSPMPEVARSGLYFQYAKRVVLCGFEHDENESFDLSDFYQRVWTLAERMHRSKSALRPLVVLDVMPLSLMEALNRASQSRDEDRMALKVAEYESSSQTTWGMRLTPEIAKLRVSAGVNSNSGLVPEVVKDFVADIICARYPILKKALALVENPRSTWAKVLSPSSLCGLSFLIRARALEEWARFPEQGDEVCQVLGFTPSDLKAFLFESTLRQARSAMARTYRVRNASASSAADQQNIVVPVPISGGTTEEHREQVVEQPLLTALDELVPIVKGLRILPEEGWETLGQALVTFAQAIMQERTSEGPSLAWLRRYLLFGVANFETSFEPDYVFAIYRLFLDGARSSYEDVEKVWKDLAALARLDLTPPQVFGWVRDLATPPINEDESLPVFFLENSRQRLDLSSFDPRNFKVFAFPPLFCRQQLTMESLFLDPDAVPQNQVLSHLIGLSFDERSAAQLRLKIGLMRSSLERSHQHSIDDEGVLSSDENARIVRFIEHNLKDLIQKSFSLATGGRNRGADEPLVTKVDNGLFILARFHGVSQLAHFLVLRTACYSPKQWTLECVGGFSTTEPMSKSSRPLALVLSNLLKHLTSLDTDEGIRLSYRSKGTCEPFVESVPLTEDVLKALETVKAHSDDEFLCEWSLNGDYNPERAESTFHGGLLLKKHSMEVGDLLVFGKTTFDAKIELNRLQKASQMVAQDNGSQDSLARYYHLLQRNYVHDTIMAQRIEYFAELSALLAHQVENLPVLLEDSDIHTSLEYFVEDMNDALAMATLNGKAQSVLDKASTALDALSNLLREATH